MKILQFLIFAIIFSTSGMAQNTFGIEIRTSMNVTLNSSKINGGGYGFIGYGITKESNLTTASYSIGILYSPSLRSTFKLHIGKHQNGRILDAIHYDDIGSQYNQDNIDDPYNYLQFVPSYSYKIIKGKLNIPIELGFVINKLKNEVDIFVPIKEHNYDIRLSTGVQYKIENLKIGGNVVFSKAIKSYEIEKYVNGKYNPFQFGFEMSFEYTIIGENDY